MSDQAFAVAAEPAFAEGSERDFGVTRAIVVQRGGQVLYEGYGSGTDASTPLLSWSMAKSITHALVGVLVRDGRLDPDAPAAAPEWQANDDPRRAITVRQLLHMRSGLTFAEDYVDAEASHCIEMLFGAGKADMGAYAAGLALETQPGSALNYSSGTTNIICRLLADIVGRGEDFAAWMRHELFDPLDMTSARPSFDDAGTFVGSSFIHATARDYAQFGQLYLDDGVWNGRRLLPEGWVADGSTPTGIDAEGSIYGSHWWVWHVDRGIYAAQGYETQRIIIVPDQDLVVVRLGKTPTELGPNVDKHLWAIIHAANR